MVVNNITESDKSIEILWAKMNDLKIGKIKVFQKDENEGQRVISFRWVITKKDKDKKLIRYY